MKTDVLCFVFFYLEGLFNSEMFRSLAFCRAGGTCVDLSKDVGFFSSKNVSFLFRFFLTAKISLNGFREGEIWANVS